MATDKRQFTMRMQDWVFDATKLIAEYEHRSMAAQMEIVLVREIEKYRDVLPNLPKNPITQS